MEITLHFQSYIALPFWPEQDEVINIQKRCWSPRMKDETRKNALQAYLDKNGMDMEYYESLVAKAARKWYKNDQGEIIVPRHQLAGMLVQTVRTSPKVVRGKFTGDCFRSLVQLGDFVTPKTEKDEIFDRYIKHELTNQRRRQIDEVITDFTAKGKVTLDETVEEEEFLCLLAYGLNRIGVGSARKMGYGRGTVKSPKVKGLYYKFLAKMAEEEREQVLKTKVKVEVEEEYSGTDV